MLESLMSYCSVVPWSWQQIVILYNGLAEHWEESDSHPIMRYIMINIRVTFPDKSGHCGGYKADTSTCI